MLNVGPDELHEIFTEWNNGELDSYLIEITADIFSKKRSGNGQSMVDVILDSAGQKGTGKWTSQSALDLGVPLSIITESVFSRFLSAMKSERVEASKVLSGPKKPDFGADRKEFIENVRKALFASKICSYAQGFAQMRAASDEYGWDLQYGNIAMIFRGGCIIRARFLQNIKDAYDRNPGLKKTCCLTNISKESWRNTRTLGEKWYRPRLRLAFRYQVSPPPWPTMTATARKDCRRTFCRHRGIISERTPSNVWTKRELSISNGWEIKFLLKKRCSARRKPLRSISSSFAGQLQRRRIDG